MYLTDYHTHSLCSPDGKYPLTAMAQAAVDAGLAELCVTDHWDLVREMGDGLILDYDWTGVLEQVAQALHRRGLGDKTQAVEQCGLPGEQVYGCLEALEGQAHYLTTLVVTD